MLRSSFVLGFAAILVTLAVSSKAQAWGGYHVGYTHYSPTTGLHHYGWTGVHAGYGGYGRSGFHDTGYGGYHYSGYHYGGYGYGSYHYGYYRRW
jgi:hypothetical protein